MTKPTKTWSYRGKCSHETLCGFSTSVTNGWDEPDMDRPREGLVYLSSHSNGPDRWCLDHEARPVHRVPHAFGAWNGYNAFARGFLWRSVSGTELVATANKFGGYDLLLTEHRPAPAGEEDFNTGSFYRAVLEGVRFEYIDRAPAAEDNLYALQDRLSGY